MWQGAIMSALTLALLEGLVAFSFRYPALSPIPPSLLRYLHVQFDRNVIQVMPECAVWDEVVTYRLKTGTCVFGNREFENVYRINRLGVRDDDASLDGPQVVMAGDSVTMGWGVDQDEAFPSVFETITGRRTLNLGISSFGTVRALRLLQRVDRTRLRHLVIQYSDNDFQENERHLTDLRTKGLSRTAYERTVEEHRRSLTYFPGKYAINMLVQLRSLLRERFAADGGRAAGVPSRALEVEVFLGVLSRSPVNLEEYMVTVIAADSGFVDAAREAASKSEALWIRSITFVDLTWVASLEGSYYVLDDHPTAIGHRAIARHLAERFAGR
jgi:hypothetical protein